MGIDANYTAALARELDGILAGARVDKIHEPERDDIVIALRGVNIKGKKLIISANAEFPRVHMTALQRENPAAAPMFCMLLRKHLTNGKILSVSAPEYERIIDIKFEVSDEMGVRTERTLTAELMGRHSNIILRSEDGRIIECLKRVDFEMSNKRQVLPGLFYELPPKQDKLAPRDYSRAELFEMICGEKGEILCDKWLLSKFLGFSPLITREITYRAGKDTSLHMSELTLPQREKMASAIFELANGTASPCIVYDGKRPFEFSYTEIGQYENAMRTERRESLSDTLAEFYEIRSVRENMKRRSSDLARIVKNARSRAERKLMLRREELKKSANREELQRRAELISANIYRLEKGMESFTAEDYYNNGKEVEIKLDVRYTPQENAEMLFREYRRMKNAETNLKRQVKDAEEELIYLETVLESIERVDSAADIEEIRDELRETGYIDRKSSAKGKQNKKSALRPYRFVSSDGITIYAGRNNRQNDALTLKGAMKNDMWLHTKNIPGSHVIIECAGRELPDRTVTEAAVIAAYFSKARESENVPVDYTPVRFVKKPQGAPPGRVIYSTSRTAYVTPDEELVERLITD